MSATSVYSTASVCNACPIHDDTLRFGCIFYLYSLATTDGRKHLPKDGNGKMCPFGNERWSSTARMRYCDDWATASGDNADVDTIVPTKTKTTTSIITSISVPGVWSGLELEG